GPTPPERAAPRGGAPPPPVALPGPSPPTPPARATRPAGVPDGFSYEITVNGKTVYAADPRLTEEQRSLISRVLKEGA
ncbi:hypothetical protein ACFV1D_47140, partial [Streptomyces mirabilis]